MSSLSPGIPLAVEAVVARVFAPEREALLGSAHGFRDALGRAFAAPRTENAFNVMATARALSISRETPYAKMDAPAMRPRGRGRA